MEICRTTPALSFVLEKIADFSLVNPLVHCNFFQLIIQRVIVNAILLQVQYRFLYELALAYMSQFDTYANFQ